MYKLAQGGGIPAGHVKVRITIDGENVDTRIVGHGPGTGCGLEDDDAILQDLLDTEVAGFGDMEDYDAGKTAEGYEATRVKAPKEKPQEESFIGGPFGPQAPQDEKKQDLGFGV